MRGRRTCRRVRRAIQDVLDRSGAEAADLLPATIREHLRQCRGCRDYHASLRSLAPMLRDELDAALRDYPAADVAAVVRRGSSRMAGPVPVSRRRLFVPGGSFAAVYRWAAVSVLTAVLATVIGLRIHSVSTTQRAIEQQIESVVEMIYREPLLPGLESALLRARPAFADYVEEMDRGVDAWLEESASPLYLN